MKHIFVRLFLLLATCSIYSQTQVKFTTANLNFRSSPSVENNVICVIPRSTKLSIQYNNREQQQWVRISYSGTSGYVCADYLKDIELKNVFEDTPNFTTASSPVRYYTNSQGYRVQSPTYFNSPPAGATALCRDGTYSFSRTRRGTCSHHGGVARWL